MERLASLDGLRGVLAVYVLLGHMAPFATLPGWLQSLVAHGGAAVDVFFALSGLVIVQSLDRVGGRALPFLIMRIARIFPVYLPVLALAVAVQTLPCGFGWMPWLPGDSAARTICVSAWPGDWLAALAAHLTMTHGLFPDAVLPDIWIHFLGAAWSLSAEWQFYLLALLVQHRRRLTWLLLTLAAFSTVWRLAGPEAWQFSRAFLGNQGHYFALGVASTGIVRREAGASRTLACVLLAVLALCATQDAFGKLLPPLAWILCVWAATHSQAGVARPLSRFLANPACLWLGSISYCLYLVNEPIHKLLAEPLARLAVGNSLLFTLLWLPAAIGLPIAASALLHAWLEAPALRAGRTLVRHLWAAKPAGANTSRTVQAVSPGL